MNSRVSLYIESEGPNSNAIRAGLSWLKETCETKNFSQALVAIPLKSNLDGAVSEVIGSQATKVLQSGKSVGLAEGIRLSLFTGNQRNPVYTWHGPVLAIYPSPKLLNQLDDLAGVTDLLVIPWSRAEVQEWIDTWDAPELGAAQSEARPLLLDMNPVLIEALKNLTDTVNVSTGISHPSDRRATIDLFRRLRKAKIDWDSRLVRVWLVRNNWQSDDADAVSEIATKVQQGKRIQGGEPFWSDEIIDLWKQRAETGNS